MLHLAVSLGHCEGEEMLLSGVAATVALTEQGLPDPGLTRALPGELVGKTLTDALGPVLAWAREQAPLRMLQSDIEAHGLACRVVDCAQGHTLLAVQDRGGTGGGGRGVCVRAVVPHDGVRWRVEVRLEGQGRRVEGRGLCGHVVGRGTVDNSVVLCYDLGLGHGAGALVEDLARVAHSGGVQRRLELALEVRGRAGGAHWARQVRGRGWGRGGGDRVRGRGREWSE